MTEPAVWNAKLARDAARVRLKGTAANLGRKLNPRAVAQEAVDGARDRAVAVADRVIDAVSRRPLVVAAAIVAVGAFLARRRIARVQRRKVEDATAPAAISYPAKRALRPAKGPKS